MPSNESADHYLQLYLESGRDEWFGMYWVYDRDTPLFMVCMRHPDLNMLVRNLSDVAATVHAARKKGQYIRERHGEVIRYFFMAQDDVPF